MPYVGVGQENSAPIELYYEDHGTGRPVILIHGWPLSGRSWEKQVPALLKAGYRVITYDRRGFGDSSKPASGYDYDTLAADLHQLITHLDLTDLSLVGFSMGGGEVARYLGKHGSSRVRQAVYISAIPPFLLKTANNPDGVEGPVFEGLMQALGKDRLAFLKAFFTDFYNVDKLGGKLVSDELLHHSWNIAALASPIATLDCVSAWLEDFRSDLAGSGIPTLVIHGDKDRIVPMQASGKRTHESVKGSDLVVVEDGPHGLTWTHSEIVNRALLEFLGKI